jgi:hypothetical protein
MDPSSIESINYWVGMAGTVAFAVTAVLAVAPRGIDIFGVLVLGVITAIGGGTLRDVICAESRQGDVEAALRALEAAAAKGFADVRRCNAMRACARWRRNPDFKSCFVRWAVARSASALRKDPRRNSRAEWRRWESNRLQIALFRMIR